MSMFIYVSDYHLLGIYCVSGKVVTTADTEEHEREKRSLL